MFRNRRGEEVTSWYTIDLRDVNEISQTNNASGTRREMALFRKVRLIEVRLANELGANEHGANEPPADSKNDEPADAAQEADDVD